MELWNDYEGRTIDGAFPLTRLLRPEGRSAFFSTANGTGVPTVIRLIESHFDGDEILARWRRIADLNHEHLVKLKQFGAVELDGTPLVYAVIEPVEANLGEILQQRRLTAAETNQVATSVLAALETLHSHGFIHEHIEPDNVLAVGETIKLRSDCIREAPEGEEGRELMRRDTHDFAALLLRALTQQPTLEAAARDLPLPAPYQQIVTKGLNGEWGLPQIAAALTTSTPAPAPKPSVPPTPPAPRPAVPQTHATQPPPAVPPQRVAPLTSSRLRTPVEDASTHGLRKLLYGAGAVLLVLLLWFFFHNRSAGSNSAAQPTPAPATEAARPAAPVADSFPAAAATATSQKSKAAGTTRTAWRVVAYTYSREDQAQKKAARIAQQHAELRPEVFTPNGHAPYLVTVGGQMTRDDAFALVRRARGEALPHDIYAQNYTAR